jgi:hypothetical protein
MVKCFQRIIIDEARSYNPNFTFTMSLSLYTITISRDREYRFMNVIYLTLFYVTPESALSYSIMIYILFNMDE